MIQFIVLSEKTDYSERTDQYLLGGQDEIGGSIKGAA